MKKWITLVLLAALLTAQSLTGNAAQDRLSIKNIEVQPGETVYLKLELTQTTVGNAVGVEYVYDETLLKPLKSSSTWANTGVLQDFDIENGRGAWADTVPSDLKGLVCTLAFEVIAEGHFETKVACQLIVKNGSADVGTFMAQATVATYCDHEYGAWEDIGALGHTHTCKHCLRKQTQSHQWDNGKTVQLEGKPGMAMTTFTCQSCGATKQIEHEANQKPTAPVETLPPETEPHYPWPTYPDPTGPHDPDHTHGTSPDGFTFPTFPGFNDDPSIPTFPDYTHNTAPTHGNSSTWPTLGDHGHDHGTIPTQDGHDHDHTGTGNKTQMDNMLILLATLAVLGGAAWLLMKKKRK